VRPESRGPGASPARAPGRAESGRRPEDASAHLGRGARAPDPRSSRAAADSTVAIAPPRFCRHFRFRRAPRPRRPRRSARASGTRGGSGGERLRAAACDGGGPWGRGPASRARRCRATRAALARPRCPGPGVSSFPTVRGLGAGTRGWGAGAGAGAGAARGEAAVVVAYSSCVL
jgi:hypothetical protein